MSRFQQVSKNSAFDNGQVLEYISMIDVLAKELKDEQLNSKMSKMNLNKKDKKIRKVQPVGDITLFMENILLSTFGKINPKNTHDGIKNLYHISKKYGLDKVKNLHITNPKFFNQYHKCVESYLELFGDCKF
jgi:hypothetical protein